MGEYLSAADQCPILQHVPTHSAQWLWLCQHFWDAPWQVLTPTLEKEPGEEDKFPGPLPDDSSSKC